MSPEQEAQQAQTITERKERIQWAANCRHVLTYKEKRKEFALVAWVLRKVNRSVDSQAQKITELKNEIALYISSSHIAHNTIAEQAKEIERLKSELQLAVEVITHDPTTIKEMQ